MAHAALWRPSQRFRQLTERFDGSDWALVALVLTSVLLVLVMGMINGSRRAVDPPPPPPPTPVSLEAALAPLALPSPSPTPPAAPTPTPAPVVQSVINAGGARARLRAQPSLSAPILERLADGTLVLELGEEVQDGPRLWRRVRSETGQVGWIESSLLRRLLSPAPTVTGGLSTR